EYDQVAHAALVGERAGAARHLNAGALELGSEAIERRRVGNFPAIEGRTFAAVLLHHDPLLAVVHAERERRAAAIDELHAEEAPAIGGPVLQAPRADANISQRLNGHRGSPAALCLPRAVIAGLVPAMTILWARHCKSKRGEG